MNIFGRNFRIMTWGESHGPVIGVVVDGVKPGLDLSDEDIQKELDRRRPGTNPITSPRHESDRVEILSGVFQGKTTGAPISLLIRNKDADSSSYERFKDIFRPGHADFTYYHKYNGFNDYRGGGRASGRETATRVAAGAIAKKILRSYKIEVVAYVKQIGEIKINKVDYNVIDKNNVRCPDAEMAIKMEEYINKIRKEGDSVGGLVEIVIKGCPIGIGSPVFDKLDAKLAYALMSIGSVKGFSVGRGFDVVSMKGSENNDQMSKEGFLSNNAGGILGGISTGQDIILNIAVKPPSSIFLPQKTISKAGEETILKLIGRHDPCICPRIVPVAEAMVAMVLVDEIAY